MRFWLLRLDAPSVEVVDETTVTITASKRANFATNDLIVMLTAPDDEGRFSSTAAVSEVTVTTEKLDDRDMVVTRVTLKDLSGLPEDAHVGLLKFSLGFVWNIENPWRHFRRGYRLLPKPDFEAIVAGEPFVARTVYHDLLRALPEPLRLGFRAEELLMGLARNDTFDAKLMRLIGYVDTRVVAASEQIVAIEGAVKGLGLQAIRHLMAEENDEGVVDADGMDDLAAQAERAKAFLDLWSERRADVLAAPAERGRRQERFEVAFRNAQ